MYYNLNGITYINGKDGIYNNKIKNKSVRYARNAVSNYKDTYSINPEYSPLEFEDLPMPKFEIEYAKTKSGKPDKMAVLAAAYEELGKKLSVKVQELTNIMRKSVSPEYANLINAASLDLNNDKKIDLAEYSASVLVKDMLSGDSEYLDGKNINGIINSDGENALLAYVNKNNYDAARYNFKTVYDEYDLKSAEKRFLSDENNLI